jgi:hypothetical protein
MFHSTWTHLHIPNLFFLAEVLVLRLTHTVAIYMQSYQVMKSTDHPYVFATQTPVQHLCALQMCELELSDWQYSKAGGYFLLFVTVGQPL